MNVSILENILYGNLNAKNSEVKQAAEIANCEGFIRQKQFQEFDDTAADYIQFMKANKAAVVEQIGATKYEEELKILTEIDAKDKEKGTFEPISGNID